VEHPVCRVTGVNGAILPEHLAEHMVDPGDWAGARNRTLQGIPTIGIALTMGSVGLALGHARAWAHIVESGVRMAIVAEDDAIFFAPTYQQELQASCSDALTDHAHHVLLQWCEGPGFGAMPPMWNKAQGDAAGISDADFMAIRPDWTKRIRMDTSAEYCQGFSLITAEGARMMLDSIFPLRVQIDTPCWDDQGEACGATRQPRLRTILNIPPIVQVDERKGESDAQIHSPDFNEASSGSASEAGSADAASEAVSADAASEAGSTGDRVQSCGGVASWGTSNNVSALLAYFAKAVALEGVLSDSQVTSTLCDQRSSLAKVRREAWAGAWDERTE